MLTIMSSAVPVPLFSQRGEDIYTTTDYETASDNDVSHRQLSLDIIFLVSAVNLKIAQFRL